MGNRITAFEMWMYRRMLRVSYVDRKTMNKFLKWFQKKTLLNKIKNGKCKYFGHIIRTYKLQRQILEGRVAGTRKRGRQRLKWITTIKEWTGM